MKLRALRIETLAAATNLVFLSLEWELDELACVYARRPFALPALVEIQFELLAFRKKKCLEAILRNSLLSLPRLRKMYAGPGGRVDNRTSGIYTACLDDHNVRGLVEGLDKRITCLRLGTNACDNGTVSWFKDTFCKASSISSSSSSTSMSIHPGHLATF